MEYFKEFIKALENKFLQPLPGLDSQLRMAPATRKLSIDSLQYKSPPRESAVLILFYPYLNKIHTVLIKRQKYQGVHSGQFAFPGGKAEKFDSSLTDTALREAREEIGIDNTQVNVVGSLTKLFIPPSNFNVLPVVGYIYKRPEFIIDKLEVENVLEIPLNQLLDAQNTQYKSIITRNQLKIDVPCYFINGHIIWGATAMMISELIDLIKLPVK